MCLVFGALVICCSWHVNSRFLHFAHILWIVRTVASPELDSTTHCSEWPQASSGMSSLLSSNQNKNLKTQCYSGESEAFGSVQA